MKKVLITGANSYVGTNVEKWLLKNPDEFSVDTADTFENKWKEMDFSNYDVVFHVAGIAHVDAKKSMAPLYYKVNRDLTIEIARYAKDKGVKQFIFMSSSIVYHESQSLKATVINKDTIPAPNTFYGDSKLQAENGIKALEDDSFKVVILRPPMIYGPNCKGNFLRLAKLGTVTPVFPDFHNRRSMLYIDNLAEFVKQIIILEKQGTFHPDNKEFADTVDIVTAFAKLNNHKLHVYKWLNVFVYLGSPFIKSLCKMFADYRIEADAKEVDFDYHVMNLEESYKYIDIRDATLTHMN